MSCPASHSRPIILFRAALRKFSAVPPSWLVAVIMFSLGVPLVVGEECENGQCPLPQSRGVGIGLSIGGWRSVPPRASRPVRPVATPVVASHPSIPRIRIRDIHGYISEFTGVLVDKAANRDFALVATVAHSFAVEPKSVEVVMSPTLIYSATVEHVDHVWDIAILSIPKPTAGAFRFADTRPREGQRFYVGGYPNGGKLTWSRGLFVGWAGPVGDYPLEWLRVGVSSTYGQSGGPILDAACRLVGLISHGDTETSGPVYWHIQAAIAKVLSGADESLPPPEPEPEPEPGNELAALRAELAALRKLIEGIERGLQGNDGETGERGEQGSQGETGSTGADGKQGLPGKAATINLDDLVDLVIAKLPPLIFQAKFPDGTPNGPPIDKYLGDTVEIRNEYLPNPEQQTGSVSVE